LRIVHNAILKSKIQEAPRFFSVWDQGNPAMNKTSRHIQRKIQKLRRTNITDHAGVLMGSTGPRSRGYSGCAAWRKPRPNTKVSHPIYKNINRAIIYAPGSSHAYIQQNHQDITTRISKWKRINYKWISLLQLNQESVQGMRKHKINT
jgi:flagellar biosynthesis/type III secretory pathway chaperone